MLIELKNGKRKEFNPVVAKVLIARGVGKEVKADLQYQTRMMQAESAIGDAGFHTPSPDAPYGYKADGTPRKRPGRPVSQ